MSEIPGAWELFSKSSVDFLLVPLGNLWRRLTFNDIMRSKDSKGGGFTAGGSSGWPKSPSKVDDMLHFCYCTLSNVWAPFSGDFGY